MSGTSSGVNSEDVPYTVVISTDNPLLMDDCEWIAQGEITITEMIDGEENVMILDFGDGTCDNMMNVTVGGVTVSVEM